MRVWDLTSPATRLKQALKDLQAARDNISDQWSDETARKFQEHFLDPLEPRVRRAVGAIGELNDVLAKAERECGSYD